MRPALVLAALLLRPAVSAPTTNVESDDTVTVDTWSPDHDRQPQDGPAQNGPPVRDQPPSWHGTVPPPWYGSVPPPWSGSVSPFWSGSIPSPWLGSLPPGGESPLQRQVLGGLISSIPWLPLEVNVPDAVAAMYRAILALINALPRPPWGRPAAATRLAPMTTQHDAAPPVLVVMPARGVAGGPLILVL